MDYLSQSSSSSVVTMQLAVLKKDDWEGFAGVRAVFVCHCFRTFGVVSEPLVLLKKQYN